MALGGLNFREWLPEMVANELEQLMAGIRSYLYTEHNEDGTHGDVTADSLEVRGVTTLVGAVTAESTLEVVGATTLTGGVQVGTADEVLDTAIANLTIDGDTFLAASAWEGKVVGIITSAINTPVLKGIIPQPSASSLRSPRLTLINASGADVTIAHNVGSGANDKIYCPNGTDYTLQPYGSVQLIWNTSAAAPTQAWVFAADAATSTSGDPAWTTPTFAAGDYTGNNSMTWTVASGDVTTLAYVVRGKTMTVAFSLVDTTVGGTPSTQLRIAIPGGYTSAKAMSVPCTLIDNGTTQAAEASVTAAGTRILITRNTGDPMAASSNNTDVRGIITFEVQ